MRAVQLGVVVGATALAVGLLSRDGWPGYVVGAVLAVSLYVMLVVGTLYSHPNRGRVPVSHLAGTAAAAVVLGGVMVWATGTTAFWAVGFILSGVLWPSMDLARRSGAAAAGTPSGRDARG